MQIALGNAYWHIKSFFRPGISTTGNLPEDAIRYLSQKNPQLRELKKRYAENSVFQHSFWGSWERHVNLLKFRGEDDYVSQAYFRQNTRRYELTYAYVESNDCLDLLNVLSEDQLFGAKTWEFVPGRLASRDLLDSIMEITFLQHALGFGVKEQFRVLDIGAGYGRFAHRFNTVYSNGFVTCIDPIATSTFLSEFYLKFRGCRGTEVVPFDRLSDLSSRKFELAVNIHSWSECTKAFISFWLDHLCEMNVPYLFIVPHTEHLETVETDGTHLTYDEELERRNFKLVLQRKKYHRSMLVQQAGIYPTEYRLYQRNAS